MIIKEVQIDKETKYKIYKKHGIMFNEIKNILLSNLHIRKTKDNKYMAIGKYNRYLTIIFKYKNGIADIITAYPSSNWQIKLFKRKGGK